MRKMCYTDGNLVLHRIQHICQSAWHFVLHHCFSTFFISKGGSWHIWHCARDLDNKIGKGIPHAGIFQLGKQDPFGIFII